jgi:hypothetical protein
MQRMRRRLPQIALAAMAAGVVAHGRAQAEITNCGDAQNILQQTQQMCDTQHLYCDDVPLYKQAVASNCGTAADQPSAPPKTKAAAKPIAKPKVGTAATKSTKPSVSLKLYLGPGPGTGKTAPLPAPASSDDIPPLKPQEVPQPLPADQLPASCGYFTKGPTEGGSFNFYAEGAFVCYRGYLYECYGENKTWIPRRSCGRADEANEAEKLERSVINTNIYAPDDEGDSGRSRSKGGAGASQASPSTSGGENSASPDDEQQQTQPDDEYDNAAQPDTAEPDAAGDESGDSSDGQ